MPARAAADGLELLLELDDVELTGVGACRGFPAPFSRVPPVFDGVVSTARKDVECTLVDGRRRCPGDEPDRVDQLRFAPACADVADRCVGIHRLPPMEPALRAAREDVHAAGSW